MSSRRDRTKRWRQAIAAELNLLPLMNVFIVLIPLLLLSAVFVEVTVIRMDGANGDAAAAEAPDPLDLEVRIAGTEYVVAARGEALRTAPRPGGDATAAPDPAAIAALGASIAEVVAMYPPDPNVKIVAAETTRYEELVAVMDVARAQGLTNAALAGVSPGGN
jgi:biopolymer transport protein ExbD